MLDKPTSPTQFADHSDTLIKHRARAGLHHEIFTTTREIWLDDDRMIRIEVEFYCSFRGYPPTRYEPGEPAQFEVAAVMPFEFQCNPDGSPGTQRRYLPAPNWLIEMLTDCVDLDSLAADVGD